MNRIIRVNQQRIARLDRAIEIAGPRMGFRGRYKLEAMRPDGRLRPLTGWFDNLITDFGLNYIGANANQLSQCCVGSGNTAPANGDTALVSLVAGGASQITSSGSVQATPPYFGTTTNVYQFGQGVAAGNLSEVGVGPNGSGTQLWSRALILDSGGSPTTITVLSDEFLNVTYQLQEYPSVVDTTGTVTIGGTVYNWTARSALVTGGNWTPYRYGDNAQINQLSVYDGAIAAITGSPAGTTNFPASNSVPAYSSGSLTNSIVSTFGLGNANYALPGGVTSLLFEAGTSAGSMGAYQIGFTDGSGHGIPKDSSSIMTLSCSFQWGRGTS